MLHTLNTALFLLSDKWTCKWWNSSFIKKDENKEKYKQQGSWSCLIEIANSIHIPTATALKAQNSKIVQNKHKGAIILGL